MKIKLVCFIQFYNDFWQCYYKKSVESKITSIDLAAFRRVSYCIHISLMKAIIEYVAKFFGADMNDPLIEIWQFHEGLRKLIIRIMILREIIQNSLIWPFSPNFDGNVVQARLLRRRCQ